MHDKDVKFWPWSSKSKGKLDYKGTPNAKKFSLIYFTSLTKLGTFIRRSIVLSLPLQ